MADSKIYTVPQSVDMNHKVFGNKGWEPPSDEEMKEAIKKTQEEFYKNKRNELVNPNVSIDEKIDQIDNVKPSMLHTIGNLAMDLGSAIAGGAAVGAGLGKAKGAIEASKVFNSVKKGVDDISQKITKSVTEHSSKQTPKIAKAMKENVDTAVGLIKGEVKPKKAVETIINNFKLEALAGPDWADDIKYIIRNDTGKTNKEIEKTIKNWVKKHADDADLIQLIEAKDPKVTFGHSVRVSRLTKDLAKELGMSEKNAETLAQAALLHDVGKISVFDRVLDSSDNFRMSNSGRNADLAKHDVTGASILKNLPADDEVQKEFRDLAERIAKTHHPKSGYGTGSTDESLVTLADIYDAITAPRSYKNEKSKSDTLFKMKDDKTIGESFIDLIEKLDDKGALKEYYPVESDLADAYDAMRANALRRYLTNQHVSRFALGGGALGGVTPTFLPTLSELKEEFFPKTRDKTELLDDIKRWYRNGYIDPSYFDLIKNTDFNNASEVRKLWDTIRKNIKH